MIDEQHTQDPPPAPRARVQLPPPPAIDDRLAYALGLIIPLVVAGMHQLLFGEHLIAPFVMLFFSVTLVSWLGGLGPGLLSVAVAAAIGNLLFIEPWDAFNLQGPGLLATAMFVPTAGSVALLAGSLRAARGRADERSEALRRSEERERARVRELEALLDATPAQLALLDAELRFVRINDAYERGCGHTRQELIGREHFAFFPDADNERIFGEVLRSGVPQRVAEKPFVFADRPELGTTWWNWSLMPIHNPAGQTEGVVLSLLDVTPQVLARQAERQVRERIERLQAVTTACSAALTPAQVARAVFDEALSRLGAKAIDVWTQDGPTTLRLEFSIPEAEQHGFGQIPLSAALPAAECARTRQPIVVEDGRAWDARFPDMTDVRRRHELQAGISLPLLVQGELLGVLGLAFTRPRHFSADVLAYLTALATQCALSLARAGSYQALQEEGRRKDRFLSMLSHELRNPLMPVRNAMFVLQRATPGSPPAQRALEIADRQSAHLARLVDDLLDQTRISQGKLRLQLDRLELGELVQRVVTDHQALFETRGVQLQLQRTGEPLWLDGDATRLAQALGNLLNNAVKFTPAGGTTRVSVTRAATPGTAEVRVEDTGVGIPTELLAKLFQPFTQAEMTLDRTLGGLGLGLAHARSLAELHGGTLSADSAGLGQGAQFSLRLPLAAPTEGPGAAARAAVAADQGARPLRVLVIEDNADAALSLSDLLQLERHVVHVAYTGPEGVERARELVPDLILCDIGLPGLDGYGVAQAVRADARLAGVRLLALSGYALPEDRQRALAAGFDGHLAKPVSPEALAAALLGLSD